MIVDKEVLKYNALMNYDLLFEYLDIKEYKEIGNQIRSFCPCHRGDNRSAFVFYLETGQWYCYTHHCHKKFGGDILGLIRTMTRCTYNKAIEILNKILDGEEIQKIVKRKRRQVDYITQHFTQPKVGKRILSRLEKNYLYVIRRGMNAEVFQRWQCGIANSGKMRGRFVIPIRDVNSEIVGFTGRNLVDSDRYPKWLHSTFRKSLNLFGIEEVSGESVVLVEGPFDVAKGKMCGISNICATLGTSLSQGQVELLKYSGVNRVYLSMDGDESGQNAAKDMHEMLSESNLESINIKIPSDFGEMSCEDIRSIYEKANNIRT